MAQQVKNPPAMQETQEMQFWSLGQEDPLEGEMVTYSSTLAWEFPWTEEPGKAPTVLGVTKSQTVWATKHKQNGLGETHTH